MIKTETLVYSYIDALLSLLQANLKSNLSIQEKQEQGFLTFEYTSVEIRSMMEEMPQPIIKVGDTVAAYALACTKEMCLGHDLLRPLVELTEKLLVKNNLFSSYKYYVMGQVCVGSDLRGKGAFDALYEYHRILFQHTYDCVVTEIAEDNVRSMAAHSRVGFQKLDTYKQQGTRWNVVMWDWK